MFYEPTSDDGTIQRTCNRIVMHLYFGTNKNEFKDLRLSVYKRNIGGKKAAELKNLPPTQEAAIQHYRQQFLQVYFK